MQVDDAAASRAVVQAVDVLGYQRVDLAGRLQCCKRGVCAVRLRTRNPLPAGEAARPVTLANLGPGDEVPVLHRSGVFPVAISIAVVRDAGRRADAGAGNNRNTARAR